MSKKHTEKADLVLTIKTKWLKKIARGEKKEEYRANSPYYHNIFKELHETSKEVTAPVIRTVKMHNRHGKFVIVELEKIRYDQYLGIVRPVPSELKYGTICYTLYIKRVISHNLTTNELN